MSQPPHEPPNLPPNQPPPGPPTAPPTGPPPPLPPPPGYGAPVPPPPAKNTGLIIGIVVGVLVLIGAIVLAVVLIVGSDDSDDSSDAKDDASSSTEPDEPDETDESDEPEETDAPEGDVLQGTGYSYELPDGWNDVSAGVEAQDAAGTIDSASAPGESLEMTFANVIVESGAANGETDLESVRDQVATNLGTAIGATPEEIDGPTIDGQETVGLQVSHENAAGIEVLQDAYVTIRDDVYYVVGYSRDSSRDEYDEDLDEILDSWTWDE